MFVCKGGYRTVKKGLQRRGWIEVDQPSAILTMGKKEKKGKDVATALCDSDDSDADNCNDASASDSDQSSDEDLSEGYKMLVGLLGYDKYCWFMLLVCFSPSDASGATQ